MSRSLDAVVVGAGASGLAAALELRRRGLEVRVLEAGDRAGGVLWTETRDGYRFERGPNTMLGKAAARPFLRAHDLERLLVAAAPASRLRFLLHDGRLEPVPLGPGSFLRTPLLSMRGKLRLLAEPFVRRGDGSSESVAEFVTRRLGREALERLVAPFLTGVYAGDERQLGAAAVFPGLVALEHDHGSLVDGGVREAIRARWTGAERALRGTLSLAGGLGELADRMAARLGDALTLGVPVTTLARADTAWCLETGGAAPERILARHVVLAVPAPEAAALLAPLEPDLAEVLRGIAYAPIASVSVGIGATDARRAPEGFGFLVPRAAGLDLLGCLFMSQLYPDRAPAGRELLTCFLGGTRAPALVGEPDDRLLARLSRDLERTLGLRAAPRLLGVTRWPRAVAQPGRDHPARIARVRALASRHPGIAVAGSWVSGVSLADTLVSGARAAQEIAGEQRAGTSGASPTAAAGASPPPPPPSAGGR